jgi:hypothetical protein
MVLPRPPLRVWVCAATEEQRDPLDLVESLLYAVSASDIMTTSPQS